MDINEELQKPLDRKVVSLRPGPDRKQLAYLEGWFVISELNRIFGHDGWNREIMYADCVYEGEKEVKIWDKAAKQYSDKTKMIKAVTYIGKVRLTVRFQIGEETIIVIREGTGTGHGQDDNYVGMAHEDAIKELETDSMKRAAMTLGWQFGLALYDKDQKHVTDSHPATSRPQEKEQEQLKVEDDTTLIDQVIEIADWIGEHTGEPDYAYNRFLGYTQNGEERVTTAPVLIAWKKKPLTPRKQNFLSSRKDKMIKEHPGAEVACQDIGF